VLSLPRIAPNGAQTAGPGESNGAVP
jgi:hypothetical protein